MAKYYTIPEETPLLVAKDFRVEYQTSHILDVLPDNEQRMHIISQKGVSKKVAEEVAANLGLTIYEFAPYLHISSRTLSRYQSDDLLDTPVSEHILFLKRLIREADELFTKEQFIRWLNSEIRALDFIKPITLLNTIFGINMVESLIGRIKYGVYS